MKNINAIKLEIIVKNPITIPVSFSLSSPVGPFNLFIA
jgi:hypothetical protein